MRWAENLTTFMRWFSWNLGASNSRNLLGLSRPVMGLIYLLSHRVQDFWSKKTIIEHKMCVLIFCTTFVWTLFILRRNNTDNFKARRPHCVSILNVWRRNYFFLILAHPVYKMWIIQEPNTLELWNKLHFEEKKNGEYIYHV